MDLVQDNAHTLALVFEGLDFMLNFGLFTIFFALNSNCSQAIWTKMTVGKVYSRHIISLLIEFAVKMN